MLNLIPRPQIWPARVMGCRLCTGVCGALKPMWLKCRVGLNPTGLDGFWVVGVGCAVEEVALHAHGWVGMGRGKAGREGGRRGIFQLWIRQDRINPPFSAVNLSPLARWRTFM